MFVDRLAVAFLSAVITFLTGTLVWVLILLLAYTIAGVSLSLASFQLVWWFTGLMALLGFFLMENIVAAILGKLWRVLYRILEILTMAR
jgi:hypothetical protein